MKTYTIIAGVNGTGKTSLTGVLKSERSDLGYIIDVDKLAAENNNNQISAGRLAVRKINELLAKQISLTQETTLSGHMVLSTVKAARDMGYNIKLFYIGLNTVGESINRIKARVARGGHDIDSEIVIRRFNSRFESLIKVLPYCNEVHLYDNENGFKEVAKYKNCELTLIGDYVPDWLSELSIKVNQAKDDQI